MQSRFFTSIYIILALLLLNACSEPIPPNKREKIISSNWEFVRLPDSNKSDQQKDNTSSVQDGSNWSSQFNVEHISAYSENSDSIQEIITNELHQIPFLSWENVNLPHTAFIEPLTVNQQWEGICYYRKSFSLNEDDQNKKLFIHFEGAMQLADVWVNGYHMIRNAGGYNPFEIDISKIAKFDQKNEILMRLDNKDNPQIPPGKPLDRLDFCYYSGLYRDVILRKTNKLYITNPISVNKIASGGVFVTYPKVNENQATINIKTHIKNDFNEVKDFVIQQDLHDNIGKLVNTSTSIIQNISSKQDQSVEQEFSLNNPQLWNLDNPYLYTLKTSITINDQMIDQVETRIGIRWVEFSREEGFKLNGEPIRLVGSNRHMDYPYVGNALSDEAQYRDMYKIKNGGFNTVRLGHYPQDPSVLYACDELGLLAIEPIPGWQFYNSDSIFTNRTFRDIQIMIRRDRNHPSIIMWETILNESWPPKWWKDKANQIAHEEFPGNQCFTSGDMYGYYGWDILYNDWDENHSRPNESKKAGFIREYGDYEFGGGNSTTRRNRDAGEEELLQSAWNFQWSHNKHRKQYPWTIGDAVWEMFDHNRGCCDDISKSGISDIFRIPKFSYHFFRSQLDPGKPLAKGFMKPEVFIANYWTERDSPSKVMVYGNVDEVELLVNGQRIAKQKPDDGPDTSYNPGSEDRTTGGNPFDGGNGKNLNHPPFTFNQVNWEAGELKALGYINGSKVAEYIVHTPEKAEILTIEMDISGKNAATNGRDILFVYVKVEDKKGTLCVLDKHLIEIQVTGANILSPNVVNAEAGIASFLIQTIEGAENIIIEASTQGSLSNTKEFHTMKH